VAVPPEPLAPDPTTLPNTPIPQPVAAYCAGLFFAYQQAAAQLREIEALQPK